MTPNPLSAGFDISVWNRWSAKAEALAAETGCRQATMPQEFANASEIVVTMLADDDDSETVHCGVDGLFEANGARLPTEVGAMSQGHIRMLANAAPPSTGVIDAPVVGTMAAAKAGGLMIMTGCTDAEAVPLIPVFEAMGRQTICLPHQHAEVIMKLAVNSPIFWINQNFAEAMTLSEAAECATEKAFDVIEASAACAPMLNTGGRSIFTRTHMMSHSLLP